MSINILSCNSGRYCITVQQLQSKGNKMHYNHYPESQAYRYGLNAREPKTRRFMIRQLILCSIMRKVFVLYPAWLRRDRAERGRTRLLG